MNKTSVSGNIAGQRGNHSIFDPPRPPRSAVFSESETAAEQAGATCFRLFTL
jgi:hypothetical protein